MWEPEIGRSLPAELDTLPRLAIDLRWSGSQFGASIWQRLDPEIWSRTQNPLLILRHAPAERFEELARDSAFIDRLSRWVAWQKEYFERPTWFDQNHRGKLQTVAYFSMEFMLNEALPIYSGGLGNVAGDQLKTASDLGVPVVGVGLLYQQGYFRQTLAPNGAQREALPFNDPASLQLTPALDPDGRWPRVRLPLPGRTLFVRAWQARVGRATLYLLDTNDPLNNPWDRGIAANLYAAEHDTRFLQEMVLGAGGWQLLEKLGIPVEVCHLNEGHAAFATLARAASFAREQGVSFEEAIWSTRPGNVFTTHTPVRAAFDRFEIARLLTQARPFLQSLEAPLERLLELGREAPHDDGHFNMAYLALRTSGYVNGVSQLHAEVSRSLFAHSFARWPLRDVPVSGVTNGIHVGTWASAAADDFWSSCSGREDWTHDLSGSCEQVATAPDTAIWQFRARARSGLVRHVRERYARQLEENGAGEALVNAARHVLDPNVLTLGFARRFTSYKRPNLLLEDEGRLARLFADRSRGVQLIVAGKAHPNDAGGKAMIQRMAQFAMSDAAAGRVVFLQDYDMALAQWLISGIDVWVNNPARGNEASGTSGMKVLVNGGLNLSELDGWWDEAYDPQYGWALGARRSDSRSAGNAEEADQLYGLLEREIIPEFYERDELGLPRRWVTRVRASMAGLTARFSSDRTVREYTERAYLPAAAAFRERTANGARLARELAAWQARLIDGWSGVRLVRYELQQAEQGSIAQLHVLFGDLSAEAVRVQLYADATPTHPAECIDAQLEGAIPGAVNGFRFTARLDGGRPARDYTPRAVAWHPSARLPLEAAQITWF